MGQFLRNQSLTLVMAALFLVSLGGQLLAGQRVYNEEQTAHDEATVGLTTYVTTGHFVESVFENWESEFLQMGAFVLLTVFLYQKGSPESKDPDNPEEEEAEPEEGRVPWPVRQGGGVRWLYEHSLSLALFLLFGVSLLLHAAGGARDASAEAVAHGESPVSFGAYLLTARMWYESFQNWQSEFMSVAALVVLSIFLRERGSPESKPVERLPSKYDLRAAASAPYDVPRTSLPQG